MLSRWFCDMLKRQIRIDFQLKLLNISWVKFILICSQIERRLVNRSLSNLLAVRSRHHEWRHSLQRQWHTIHAYKIETCATFPCILTFWLFIIFEILIIQQRILSAFNFKYFLPITIFYRAWIINIYFNYAICFASNMYSVINTFIDYYRYLFATCNDHWNKTSPFHVVDLFHLPTVRFDHNLPNMENEYFIWSMKKAAKIKL